MILIVVDFNFHGLNHIGIGWNTHLQWMRYIRHVGKDPNSPHKIVVKCCEDLKNYSRHIDKLIEKQMSKELENNRLRLKTSIECARWLAFQACAFRDHDESLDSKN